MNIKLSTICWLMLAIALLPGCSFEKIGRQAGTGLSQGLIPASDSIGRNLINAVRTELTKDTSREQLKHFIDSLLAPVSLFVKNTAGSARDSVVNHQTLLWADSFMQTVSGKKLNENILLLQASLVGKTKADIYEIERSLQQMLGDMLGDSTRIKVGILRDELLSQKTGLALSRIIDTAVTHIVDSSVSRLSKRLRSDIDPLVRGDISFVRRNAVILLASLAALAAIIITLIWLNRRKYLQMVAMLTKQIHDIPDQHVYDILTARIKNEAVTAGLEPTLRKVLDENGLLGSESWKKNKLET